MKTHNSTSPVTGHFTEKDFNQLILTKIEHILNIIIPVTIPLVVLLAINDYLRHNVLILIIDASIAVSLFALTLLKKNISNWFKIIIIALLTFIAGFTSILVSGFAGAGMLTLLAGAMLVTGFSSKRVSILYGLFLAATLGFSILLIHLNVFGYDLSDPKFNPNLVHSWINLLLVFYICLLVIIVIITVLKRNFGASLRETEEKLTVINHLAFYDTLTGLPNKNKLLSENDALHDDAGMLVLFSIDGYTLIDSIYGEEVTNEIIIAISELLEDRKDNFLAFARTDVNEFAFIWKKSRQADFFPFMETSIQALQNHQRLVKWKRGIHFHLGYFLCEEPPGNLLDSYQKAKIALQEAKVNHASLPVKYNEDMEARIRGEYNFRQTVDEAITSNEFTVYYQEKVDNQTEQVVGVEALARWNHETLGMVPPSVFIPVVDRSTLYSVFGNQIIRMVLNDYPKLCAKYSDDIMVSINVSPQHLLSPDFISLISDKSILERIKPESIIFEITEETLIDNIEYTLTIIKDIKQLGYRISLDDFGSGYSSLAYLSRLLFDELKIDKSFIDQVVTDEKIAKLIEIIAELKDVYGFTVVAEGVETQAQYDILKQIGHFIIQGYYFSKPKPL